MQTLFSEVISINLVHKWKTFLSKFQIETLEDPLIEEVSITGIQVNSKPQCQICGKIGNIALDYWLRFDQPIISVFINFQSGHVSYDSCPLLLIQVAILNRVQQIILLSMLIIWQPSWIMLEMIKLGVQWVVSCRVDKKSYDKWVVPGQPVYETGRKIINPNPSQL